jgi:C1A family cysteine protease
MTRPQGLRAVLIIASLVLVGWSAALGESLGEASAIPQSYSTGYVPPEFELPYVAPRAPRTLEPPPARFDWREHGILTRVQDQNLGISCGACYAFAGLGNFESRIQIDGGGSFDFSENNIKECEPNKYKCVGGNYWVVANQLSTRGAVLETCDPYSGYLTGCNETCPSVKTLLGWTVISERWIPSPEELKGHIMNDGPVFAAINAGHGDPWYNEFWNYNGGYTLYFDGIGAVNHAVLIVGWDDSLSHIGGKGAWIAKNSWGTGWGGPCGYGTEDGYMTIAYGSANIGQGASYVSEWEDWDAEEALFYYDEAGVTYYYGYPSETVAWGMCKYIPARDFKVKRVEFWTVDAVVDADIYIYDTFSGGATSDLLASKLDLAFDNMGYHSIALENGPLLHAGDAVYVVLKLRNATSTYPLSYDYKIARTPGTSYVSRDGVAWVEFTGGDLGIRLRVTEQFDSTAPDLSLSIEQDPDSTGRIDVLVGASEGLVDSSLHVAVGDDAVVMQPAGVGGRAYSGRYMIPAAGSVSVTAEAADSAGNVGTAELEAYASLVVGGEGGEIVSADGRLSVRAAGRVVWRDSAFVLVQGLEGVPYGVISAYRVTPSEIELKDFVEISIAYDDTVRAPERLCLARIDGGQAVLLKSYLEADRRRIVAYVDTLGSYGLYRADDVATPPISTQGFRLRQNAPNPFSGGTEIVYEMADAGRLRMDIFTVEGRLVRTLVDADVPRGLHRTEWHGTDSGGKLVANGVYFLRAVSSSGRASRKLVVAN